MTGVLQHPDLELIQLVDWAIRYAKIYLLFLICRRYSFICDVSLNTPGLGIPSLCLESYVVLMFRQKLILHELITLMLCFLIPHLHLKVGMLRRQMGIKDDFSFFCGKEKFYSGLRMLDVSN